MPPRKKTETDVATNPDFTPNPYGIELGDFVNVVINGQARHKTAEVLNFTDRGITVRTHAHGLSMAEVTFVPWNAIEGVGLVGKR